MKISIIVPVFNTEKYLEKCLDSISSQTYKEYEVILVDDGSSDASGEICDRCAKNDKRIKVIHKQNEGSTSARKEGIQKAEGDYIAFVDSDDWIESDFIEKLMNVMEANAADIVMTGCVKEIDGKQEVLFNISKGIYDKQELIEQVFPKMLYYGGFFEFGVQPYMWNKLYKRQLLSKFYEHIDTFIYDGEDAAVVFPYLLYSQKAVITDDIKYHYRIHSQSVTGTRKPEYYENVSRLYLYLKNQLKNTEYYDVMFPQLDAYMRMMTWRGNPKGFIASTLYSFPFRKIPMGSEIILYGAGYVGQIFRYQLHMSKYCGVVAWVDRDHQKEELKNMGVVGLESLNGSKYDYIVIAISDSRVASEVMKQLQGYGVNSKKIVLCDV